MFGRKQSPLSLLLTIIAMLLLGAVLNVLVAWGIVCWRPPIAATTPAAPFWPAEVPQDWPMPGEMYSARWIGFEYAYAYGSNVAEAATARREARLYAVPRKGEDNAGRLQAYEELAATLRLRWALLHSVKSGWPMLSMSCDERRFAARFYATTPPGHCIPEPDSTSPTGFPGATTRRARAAACPPASSPPASRSTRCSTPPRARWRSGVPEPSVGTVAQGPATAPPATTISAARRTASAPNAGGKYR